MVLPKSYLLDKKVLLVTYYFPPYKAIGAYRNYNIASLFSKNITGDVTVIHSDNYKHNFENDSYDYNRINRMAVWTFDINNIKYFIKRFTKNKSKQSANIVSYSKPDFIEKIVTSFPFFIIWGVGGIFYFIGALMKSVKMVDKNTIVYTSFSPIIDHLIGYVIKKLSPQTIWVADFRDCYTHPDINPVSFPKLHRFLLKKLIQKADICTTVSNGLKIYFDSILPNKVLVLRNAFGEDISNNRVDEKVEYNKFRISYTGILYEGQRDPSPLFKAIKQLEERMDISCVELCYAGKDTNVWNTLIEKHNLGKYNSCQGVISRNECIKIQQSSQINLLLTWTLPNLKGILTGKFFEYLAANKTIILLINGGKDEEFEHIFEDIGCGKIFYSIDDVDHIVMYLQKAIAEYKQQGRVKMLYNESINNYSWEAQFSLLKHQIDVICNDFKTK